jgi:hypothetical protein
VFEGIQDLKASPSPKKVPSLNVSCLTRTLYFYSLLSAMVHLQSLSIALLCFVTASKFILTAGSSTAVKQ